MKFNPNIRNVLATGVIASVFAFSFSIGGISAFAEGSATDTQNTAETQTSDSQTTVQDTSGSQTDASATTEQDSTGTQTDASATDSTVQDTTGTQADNSSATTTDSSQSTTDATESTDSPSLLPGDFFYFVKTITEKIQLALTFDDKDKAMKLADFAQERLAEAQELMDQGQIDLAKQTIEEALKQQQEAEQTAEGATEDTTSNATQNGDDATSDTTQSGDEGGSDLTSQLQSQFGHNILALQAALDKVQNPKAKAALAKNIEKAQQHVEKMLAKKHVEQNPTPSDEDQTVKTDDEAGKEESQPVTEQGQIQSKVEPTKAVEHKEAPAKKPEVAHAEKTEVKKQPVQSQAGKQSPKAPTVTNQDKQSSTKVDDKASEDNQVQTETAEQPKHDNNGHNQGNKHGK